jgi:hypothetical protein
MDEKHCTLISTFQETKNRKVMTYPKPHSKLSEELGLGPKNSVSSQTSVTLILKEYS